MRPVCGGPHKVGEDSLFDAEEVVRNEYGSDDKVSKVKSAEEHPNGYGVE
jgi:hypothetical protein